MATEDRRKSVLMDQRYIQRKVGRFVESTLPRLAELPSGAVPSYAFPTAVFAGGNYGDPSTVAVPLGAESCEMKRPRPLFGNPVKPQNVLRVDGQTTRDFWMIPAPVDSLIEDSISSTGSTATLRTCFKEHAKKLFWFTGASRGSGFFQKARARTELTQSTSRSHRKKFETQNIKRNLRITSGDSYQQSHWAERADPNRDFAVLKHAVPFHRTVLGDAYQRGVRRQRSRAIAIKRNRVAATDEFEASPVCSSSERMYDWATWRMYNRIIDYRRKRPVTHAVSAHAVTGASRLSRDNILCDEYNPNIPYSYGQQSDYFLDGEVFELEI